MKIFRIVINVTYRFGWVLTDLFVLKYLFLMIYFIHLYATSLADPYGHTAAMRPTPPPIGTKLLYFHVVLINFSSRVPFWKYWIRHCTYLYFTLYLLHLYIFIFKDTFTDTYGNKIHQVTHTYTYNTTIRITVSWLIEITKII